MFGCNYSPDLTALQDIDEMWEADAAAEWERINEPEEYEGKLIEASVPLARACDLLYDVIDKVSEAADDLEDLPDMDRVLSCSNALEDLLAELKKMKESFEKGVRL